MWFEWDPETLNWPKAYIVVTWDWSSLVIFDLEVAVNRRPKFQIVGTLVPTRRINWWWGMWLLMWTHPEVHEGQSECSDPQQKDVSKSLWRIDCPSLALQKLFLIAKVNWEGRVHSYKVEISAKQLFCRYFLAFLQVEIVLSCIYAVQPSLWSNRVVIVLRDQSWMW